MDNTNYVNVNPLPDEVGGVNQAGNTEEIRESAVESTDTSTESVSDEDAAEKAQELMRLISDPNILKAYRDIRSDVYGKKRTQVSKKDVKKKKAKRRMAKKSRRG
jgi:hypothetical protein